MIKISEVAYTWARIIRKYNWPNTLEKDIQKAINEAMGEKNAEIERLKGAITNAREVADAERNAGIVNECPECRRMRNVIEKITRISCGEEQVANNDTDGMEIIYRICREAFVNEEDAEIEQLKNKVKEYHPQPDHSQSPHYAGGEE